VLSIVVASVLVLVGVAALGIHLSQSQPAAVASPSPTPSATPTGTPDPTANWPTYMSTNWGYTVKYPATWYDLPNSGAPDADKYFSNQKVANPAQMEPGGVWLTIRIEQDPSFNCTTGPTKTFHC